ncbi:MAG: metallophosphoesterase [Bacteroidales bacterium]|nr:metallophosphoesterase [Bacteroidales bacterium]
MEHLFLRIRIILISFTVITDLLFYFLLLYLLPDGFFLSPLYLNLVFWSVPLVLIVMILSFKFDPSRREIRILARLYRISGFFMTIYIPKIVLLAFHLINILFNMLAKGTELIINVILADPVAFRTFPCITYAGIVSAVILFILLAYGTLIGRFSFKTEKIALGFKNLPASFDNFRIVHISDIHLGSWYRKEKKMEKAVGLINSLAPDLILFTGDLVNNFSEETNGWSDILRKASARYGKYSVLGNHDYGDYWEWKSEKEKQENMQLLYSAHKKMDFKLLLNKAETIGINGHEIGIIGVEN